MTAYLEKIVTNKLYGDILFFFVVFFSIFNFIPENLRINMIAGPMASKLSFYPLLLLFIFSIYSQYKYKNVFVNFKIFKNYFFVYIFFVLLSFIIGAYLYPYYDEVIVGPVNVSYKLSLIIDYLNKFNISISQNVLAFYYFLLWNIKNFLTYAFWYLIGSYLIYCLYYNSWQKAYKIIILGVLSALFVIFSYSIVEIFYLTGNEFAKEILITINPYIHVVESGYGWWPPLLLNGQLRSVFVEPSNIGLWSAFAIPFLWYKIFTLTNNIRIILLVTWANLCFLCFLTNARTVMALLVIELVLLLCSIIVYRRKDYINNVVLIFFSCISMFFFANIFIQNCFVNNIFKINSVEKYVETNIASITSTQKRSNSARYSVAIANFKLGIDYPLFGVGYGLTDGYIRYYLPEMAENSGEVRMWIEQQKDKGVIKSGFPKLNEYASLFAETGIIGLVVFLLPGLYLLSKLKTIILSKNIFVNKLPFIMFAISLLGVLASGFSAVLNAFYCYWVLLGLGYAMCFGKENDVKDNGDTCSRQKH